MLLKGALMLTLKVFDAGDHRGEGLGSGDLYAIGIALLGVQVVSVRELLARFSAADSDPAHAAPADAPAQPLGPIVMYGAIGMAGSFLGGHAVGDFADALVDALSHRGYSEMVGAIIVSLFSGIASYLMIASAHFKKKTDLALSNVSGAVTQMPFVVLPLTLIMMATFANVGVIPRLPHGGGGGAAGAPEAVDGGGLRAAEGRAVGLAGGRGDGVVRDELAGGVLGVPAGGAAGLSRSAGGVGGEAVAAVADAALGRSSRDPMSRGAAAHSGLFQVVTSLREVAALLSTSNSSTIDGRS